MIRREFIKAGALIAGTLISPVSLFANSPKIRIAVLGTGWWGTDVVLTGILATNLFEVVGLCDVNSSALEKAVNKVVESGQPKPALFSDYKQMYNMPGLQAVAIVTPTHWHALMFIDACKKGLHVFLEKPISYDIREGQAMLAAHKKAKNVVQVDFPRTMVDTNAKVRDYLKSGEPGKVLQVIANINYPEGELVEKDVLKTLDYEAFCGPAPKLKYICSPDSVTPNWRGQHGFSRGIMVDWGIHYIHNIRKVLGLTLPASVSAIGGSTRNFTTDNPDHLTVHFDFNGLPVYWTHKAWGYTSPAPDYDIGVYYFCEKETVFAGDLGWQVFSKGSEKVANGDVRFQPWTPEQGIKYQKMTTDMFVEFSNGVHTNSNEGISNTFEEAQKTTACVTYGDMTYRAKSSFSINQKTMEIENSSVAQGMLKREYRLPYKHPYSG